MTMFRGRTRLAAGIVAVGLALLLVGAAIGAAGDAVILGASNDAGYAETGLTTVGTGTTLFVIQGGSGTAIRGSTGAGTGIAGFFTSTFGSALSGVVGNQNGYGLYASSDSQTAGSGAAIRANGKLNAGIVATSDGKNAVGAYASACSGVGPACGASGVDARGYGFAGAVHGDGTNSFAGLWASEGSLAGVYSAVTSPGVPGVMAESSAGTAVVGLGANAGARQDLPAAGGEFLGTYGVIGQTDSPYGAGVYGTTTSESSHAVYSDGNAYVNGDLGLSGVCTGCTTAIVAVNGSTTGISQGEAVAVRGVRTTPDGVVVVVVTAAKRGERVLGIADRSLTLAAGSATIGGGSRTIKVVGKGDVSVEGRKATIKAPSPIWQPGALSAAANGYLRVITSGMFSYQPSSAPALAAGDQLAVGATPGSLGRAGASAGRGTIAGTFLGTLDDRRVVILVQPS